MLFAGALRYATRAIGTVLRRILVTPYSLTASGTFRAGAAALAASCLALTAHPAAAQDDAAPAQPDYVENLKACQQITDDAARLACFDNAVGAIIAANDAGDVQVIDKEDVRQTRRSLFGFTLPNIGLFGGGDDDEASELFETTIESVRYLPRNSARFTTAEGAVWELNNIPSRLRRIESGDRVVFKKASLGYFFVRIEGQTGIKGRRVE